MFQLNVDLGNSAQGVMRAIGLSAAIAIGAVALLWGAPAFAQAGGCPNLNGIPDQTQIDNNVQLTVATTQTVNPNDTNTYSVSSVNENPVAGVPGLIELCVYPSQPPANPTGYPAATPAIPGVIALYDSWNPIDLGQGDFAFKRPTGNANLPFDGTQNVAVGKGIWNPNECVNGLTNGCAPQCTNVFDGSCPAGDFSETVILHVADAATCTGLHGAPTLTCFVYPGNIQHGPPIVPPCNFGGLQQPACKEVVIDEAVPGGSLNVPGETVLHIHYFYFIVNQNTLGSGVNMFFTAPTPKTQDINTGGGKDAFGCEQQPDTKGLPADLNPANVGGWGIYPGYPATGLQMNLMQGKGNGCPQSSFTVQVPVGGNNFVIPPQGSLQFEVDMVTRLNKGGNQEFTSCGLHLLNSGFTIKWFQTDKPGILQSFSTNVTPIYVNVVSSSDDPDSTGNLVCSS